MPTQINLGVEEDHIESLTKANEINAISELIWNSLDADATKIERNDFENIYRKRFTDNDRKSDLNIKTYFRSKDNDEIINLGSIKTTLNVTIQV